MGHHPELLVRPTEPGILPSLDVVIPTSDGASVNRKLKPFIGSSMLLLYQLVIGDIPNRACHKNAFGGLDRTQTYLNRDLRSVFAQPEQLEFVSHWPDSRLGEKGIA